MPKIGRFTSEEAEAAFLSAYDAMAAKWPVPSTIVDVETSFGTTRVRRSGDGEGAPIVLLPGVGGNGQVWLRFIEDLARDHVVYTPDVMGWAGRCVQTAPLRDAEDIAKWMSEVLDGLGEDRVHLAGNSLGAWLAGAIAVYRSDRLASLTMLEPSGATFSKPRWSLLFKFLIAGMRPTPERMRKLNQWLMPRADLPEEEFAAAMTIMKFRMALPWDRPFTDAQLAAIAAPTLVLIGAETVVNDPEIVSARAREHIPSAEVEIFPGVGHDLFWANPEQVIPRFLRFTDTHDPIRASRAR
ncbi:alpha/beta fold hydrolase [Nocardia inohanensis]|uniref:alpha/beta fold hydrolase n=1 Tax=Nocardia inohanensis TaxID=209246 RepID=UPI00083594A8|nr:alpha/beta fold hydrolase [Nocardia inohanensis]